MKKYNLLLIIFLFLLIYYPPLLSINMLHIIGLFSWIYIIFHRKSIGEKLNVTKIVGMYLLFILLVTYIFIIAFINDNSFIITTAFLYWMVDIIPGCIVTIDICLRKKYTQTDLITLLLIVGSVQGVLAFLAFIIPEFQFAFINQMLSYGYGDVYSAVATFRMYGVASNLTFSTPVIQSILAMIAFYLATKVNIKYLAFFPLLAFSAVINARTSIVVMIVGIIAIFLSSRKLNFKQMPKAIILVCLSIVVLKGLLYWVEIGSPETYMWIDNGFNEIIAFINGDATGYFTYISDQNRYALPTGFNLLFGNGVNILFRSKYGVASDIGWINDIWVGGFVYSFIIYIFYGRILLDINRHGASHTELCRFLSIFLFGIFLVVNFKGSIIGANEVMTVIFLIFLFVTNRHHVPIGLDTNFRN
jgi:hypothetical protein